MKPLQNENENFIFVGIQIIHYCGMSAIKRTARENAADMVEKKLSDKTKMNYRGRIKALKMISEHEEKPISDLYNTENDELTLPLPVPVLIEFFGYIGNVSEEGDQYKAVSTVGGFRSAIVDLYKSHRISNMFPSDEISDFISGYKRNIAYEKLAGHVTLQEGKRAVTFESYRKLAQLATSAATSASQYINMTLFMLLSWNLMCRSISTANLMYTHMTWIGDALVVNLPKTKGDQEGSKSYPKHMYAVLNQLPPGVADDVFQVAFKSLMESDAENGTSNKQTPRRVELWYCLQCLNEKKMIMCFK